MPFQNLESLTQHIADGIADRGYRMVFDNVFDVRWPPASPDDRQQQQAAIAKFAAEHRWQVKFYREGKQARFEANTGS